MVKSSQRDPASSSGSYRFILNLASGISIYAPVVRTSQGPLPCPSNGALRLIVGKRVFEPRRIIPRRVIGARVRAPGFTSGQRSSRRSQGHIQHTLQLKSTDHVQIEYSTRMAQSNVGHPMFESEQLVQTFGHHLFLSENAEVILHGSGHVRPDGIRILRALSGSKFLQAALNLLLSFARGNLPALPDFKALNILGNSRSGPPTKDNGLQQGVSPQAIGSVHRNAGTLSCSIQPWDLGGSVHISVYAAHGVVLTRHNGYASFYRIYALKMDG